MDNCSTSVLQSRPKHSNNKQKSITLPEKKSFLDKAADEEIYLFMQHDAHNEDITVKHTEKGVRHDQTYTFNELFN